MTRFDYDDFDTEGSVPWGLWEVIVSRALASPRGQEVLAKMEKALLDLPEPKLTQGHLAAPDGVCAVGAYVAAERAKREGTELVDVVKAMCDLECWCGHKRESHVDGGGCSASDGLKVCRCRYFDPDDNGLLDTVEAGMDSGMTHTVAWHLAWLNDEEFALATEEERHAKMLAWVRRAQGKAEVL